MSAGLDVLGLAHRQFPVDALARLIPPSTPIGALDDDFGTRALSRIVKLVMTGNVPEVRMHLWWSDDHKISPLDNVREKALKWQKFAADYARIRVYLSHSLEHNETNHTEVVKRIEAIRTLAPSCVPVNCVWKGAIIPGCMTETHKAPTPDGAYIKSTDGENCYDIDIVNWHRRHERAVIRFLWGARFNLREIPDPGQSVPAIKLRNAAPSPQYIESVIRQLVIPGPAPLPAFRGEVKRLEKPNLWKSHSEDDQEPDPATSDDPRENRPVLICGATRDVEVVTRSGEKVTTLRVGGDYAGGLHRFYCPQLYGYEVADRARKQSGSEFVWFKIGRDKYLGPCHPAFRLGYFR